MTSTNKNSGGGPLIGKFKEELYSELEKGSEHLESERNRLLFRLENEKKRSGAEVVVTRRFTFGAAAAAAVAAACALFLVHQNPEAPKTPEPLEVRTALSGQSLVLEDDSTLWLDAYTDVTIEKKERPFIRLKKGRVLLDVATRPGALKVKTPHVLVVVRGTAFSVSVSGEETRVRLHRGEVALMVGGKTETMRPGTEAKISSDSSIQMDSITPKGAVADLMIFEKSEETAEEKETPPPRAASKKRKTPEPKEPETEPRGPRKPLFILDDIKIEEVPKEVATLDAGDAEELDPSQARRADAPVDEARSGDMAADIALFARIRSLVKNGRCEKAVVAADEYLSDLQSGAHREDVLYLRAFCEARMGNLKKSRELFETYLSSYPNGRYWNRITEILGN